MPSMNISLTQELMEIIHKKVEGGMYNNASEFIREAIRNVDKHDELLFELKLARLKDQLQPGIESAHRGEYADYSFKALMESMDQKA